MGSAEGILDRGELGSGTDKARGVSKKICQLLARSKARELESRLEEEEREGEEEKRERERERG